MLYLDTGVLLALLTPEVHSPFATAFLEEASEALAISSWSTTELHSALALKVRTGALNPWEGGQSRLRLTSSGTRVLTYRIEFVRSAAKAYTRLDPVLQRRVVRELSRLRERPHHALCLPSSTG